MQSKKQKAFHQKSKKGISRPKKTRSKRKVEDMLVNELYEKILIEKNDGKRFRYMDYGSKFLILGCYVIFILTIILAVWSLCRIGFNISKIIPVNVAILVFTFTTSYNLLLNTRKSFEDRVKSIIEYKKRNEQH